MHVVLLILLILLAVVGLLAILFFCGYRRLAASKGPRPSRFSAYKSDDCQHLPPHIYRRPDPMIYSQGLVTLRTEERKKPVSRLSSGDCDRRTPSVHRRGTEAAMRRR